MQVDTPKKGYKFAKWYFGKHLEIPEEWEEKKLEEVMDVFGTGDWGNDDAKVIPDGFTRVKVIRNADFKNWENKFGKTGTNRLIETRHLTRELVKENDILLEGSGGGPDQPVGRTILITKDVFQNSELPIISSNFLKRMRPKSVVNAKFLNYFLKLLYNNGITKNFEIKTSNLRNFEFKWFNKTSLIPLPPLPEQRQIVSIISNVDDTIQKTDQIIKQTQRLKKGMMQKILTMGMGHSKFKKVKWYFGKEIQIPGEWEITPIGKFLDIVMGVSPPSETYNTDSTGLPFFQGNADFGEIFPKTRIWCSEPNRIAQLNQILLSVRAPVGEINLTNLECCIGRGIATLTPIKFDLMYCFYLLKFHSKRLRQFSQGSTFEAINRKDLVNLCLPFTKNIEEQKQIASILSNIDTQIQKEKTHKSNLERLKKGLMQKLLTGQIRVTV